MKTKKSKATDIPQPVKLKVWERDKHCCVLCGSPYAMPNAHYIPRSDGGLGIEENVLTLCLNCHIEYDNSEHRQDIKKVLKKYLEGKYPNLDERKLRYNKYRWLDEN